MTTLSPEQIERLRGQFEIWWRPKVTEENFAGYSTAEIEHEEWRAWQGYLAHAAMVAAAPPPPGETPAPQTMPEGNDA